MDNEEQDELDKQARIRAKSIERIKPYQFKKGQSGNPEGRPPGKTLKEYSRDFLAKMTDDERQNFLNGLSKEVIWKMAEGNPEQEVKGGVTISEIINKIKKDEDNKPTTDGTERNDIK